MKRHADTQGKASMAKESKLPMSGGNSMNRASHLKSSHGRSMQEHANLDSGNYMPKYTPSEIKNGPFKYGK